jgi:hypothetical protein
MAANSNLGADVEQPCMPLGSRFPKQWTPLDRERAASMADEGGAAAAFMEAREQWSLLAEDGGGKSRRAIWLIWGGLGIAALTSFFLLRHRTLAAC